jgi:invasion protein IalB
MKKIILTTAAASFAIMFAATGTASAQQTRATTIKPAQTTNALMKIAPVRGGATSAQHNSGPAWTTACYAEFGPNAKYPDAAMLEKCLNW